MPERYFIEEFYLRRKIKLYHTDNQEMGGNVIITKESITHTDKCHFQTVRF